MRHETCVIDQRGMLPKISNTLKGSCEYLMLDATYADTDIIPRGNIRITCLVHMFIPLLAALYYDSTGYRST